MKTIKLFPAVLGLALVTAGCGHLDTTPEGDPDRVVTGTVTYDFPTALPPDAVVTVRVISESPPDSAVSVLGEQKITNPGTPPIPFRVEYRAEDAELMHVVRVDARITIGGKLSYYSVAGYPITLRNATAPHRVVVERVAGR